MLDPRPISTTYQNLNTDELIALLPDDPFQPPKVT